MGTQMIFRRYELKYLLTQEQKQAVQEAMEPHMALDRYGRTTIRNLYFDTDSFLLARHSIEHPAYKEKLRVRSYREASPELPVYVELKKKYDSVVYKRRLALPEEQAVDWLAGLNAPPVCTQIAREVEYFRQYYRTLAPRVYLSYEREAYYDRNGGDFRVTFDENILSRTDDLTLEAPPWGQALLEPGLTLMEIKTSGGIPLWMTHVLTELHIYRTSFSKYGTAYQNFLLPCVQGGRRYA
ncbi:MAG: polyphosphate polymerase domain-containing protein [Clostridiales bacterium]|nr:polyphosphate polymerase domain-containing protein [Clostridiales bacterium]MCD7802281.1 polyphosphate polymerase domain-containing protein [Clostridiales bacterium]MCD8384055.1 polyphosphate polymerase domain-containing protein [Clostridiales bacterium]